jgi:twitching motility protein PilI
MADHETLQELQARLAQRLSQARTSAASMSWLAVTAGSGKYLLPLRQSGEILANAHWQTVPHAKPWFLGVMNLRGTLFGAVDLHQFIGQFEAYGDEKDAIVDMLPPEDDASCVVTISSDIETSCSLRVGSLVGLRGRETFVSHSATPPGAPSFFGLQFIDAQGERWQEINLQTLSRSPEFLTISA